MTCRRRSPRLRRLANGTTRAASAPLLDRLRLGESGLGRSALGRSGLGHRRARRLACERARGGGARIRRSHSPNHGDLGGRGGGAVAERSRRRHPARRRKGERLEEPSWGSGRRNGRRFGRGRPLRRGARPRRIRGGPGRGRDGSPGQFPAAGLAARLPAKDQLRAAELARWNLCALPQCHPRPLIRVGESPRPSAPV